MLFGFLFAGVVNHLQDFCHIGIYRAARKVSAKWCVVLENQSSLTRMALS